jgi:hypothetical protein
VEDEHGWTFLPFQSPIADRVRADADSLFLHWHACQLVKEDIHFASTANQTVWKGKYSDVWVKSNAARHSCLYSVNDFGKRSSGDCKRLQRTKKRNVVATNDKTSRIDSDDDSPSYGLIEQMHFDLPEDNPSSDRDCGVVGQSVLEPLTFLEDMVFHYAPPAKGAYIADAVNFAEWSEEVGSSAFIHVDQTGNGIIFEGSSLLQYVLKLRQSSNTIVLDTKCVVLNERLKLFLDFQSSANKPLVEPLQVYPLRTFDAQQVMARWKGLP